jgi:hypothetical protein
LATELLRATGPLTITPGVLAQRVGSEAVLLHEPRGLYFGLNEVGTRIWECLAAGRSPREIHAQLLTEFSVPGGVLWNDVLTLLEELMAAGLVSLDSTRSRA